MIWDPPVNPMSSDLLRSLQCHGCEPVWMRKSGKEDSKTWFIGNKPVHIPPHREDENVRFGGNYVMLGCEWVDEHVLKLHRLDYQLSNRSYLLDPRLSTNDIQALVALTQTHRERDLCRQDQNLEPRPVPAIRNGYATSTTYHEPSTEFTADEADTNDEDPTEENESDDEEVNEDVNHEEPDGGHAPDGEADEEENEDGMSYAPHLCLRGSVLATRPGLLHGFVAQVTSVVMAWYLETSGCWADKDFRRCYMRRRPYDLKKGCHELQVLSSGAAGGFQRVDPED
ncbi:hypothetical protein K490DRAFT_55441 [Saccharata proteae CBS 121410]|uniref:Uncharacterized protein n=1 Tax=Saccharata proteae CBS 121410 TaxID=1314787 RepID=A0A6A5YBE3_9PEZI|nr:hypothetical protein K490DRAFT_55441 [Saccharata proteae CBS 121410]